MLNRLAALFRRYCDAHDTMEGRPADLIRADGRVVARIERLVLEHAQLRVAGWAGAGMMQLCISGATPGGSLETTTRIATGGGEQDSGTFDLVLPWVRPEDAPDLVSSDMSAELRFTAAQDTPAPPGHSPLVLPLILPDPRLHRLRLGLRFAGQMIRLVPALAGWALTRDPRHRQSVKRGLGLDRLEHCGPLAPRIFAIDAPTAPDPGLAADDPMVILLPVYNAHDLLLECLERVRANTDLPWRMIAIEDGSSDARIRPALRTWAAAMNAQAPHRVQVIEHDTNRGFIGAINAGFDAVLAGPGAGWGTGQAAGTGQEIGPEQAPVVLLNSDALVPPGWAGRLIAPIRADRGVASVTPMSNDAEIFSVPAICTRTGLRPGQAEAIDRAAQRLDPRVTLATAPTGVGFCMAISRPHLLALPRFDTAFGRGYGEEVDWCQKIRAMGGRHVGLAGLFVEHRGGASFGSEEKLAMVAANNRIVAQRYPAYDGEVQRFIRDDPLLSARMALGMVWAGSLAMTDPTPIYLAHSLGGGAEHWLQAQLAAHPGPSVVLRVGGGARWRVELHSGGDTGNASMTAATTDDFDLVLQLLEPLGKRRIIYSCGVGDRDPLSLSDCLRRLRRSDDDRIEVLFHDYLPISPSYTLLDGDGGFRGAVTPERVADPARRRHAGVHQPASHGFASTNTQRATLGHWQATWGDLLQRADEIRVFSEAARTLVLASWPQLDTTIRVKPHALLHDVPRLKAPAPNARPVVAVLGNIAPHKGAALVVRLGRELGKKAGNRSGSKSAPKLVLIGQIDPAYTLARHVVVHGSYAVPELPALVKRYGITHWLIPSVWPETFSFATHEALATGLPVLAFDIGAQGDAVARADNGHAIAYDPDADLSLRVLDALEEST